MGVAEAERLREITCGLLANVCAHRSLRRQVIEDPSLSQELLRAFHTTDDPVSLTEILRLLSTAAKAASAAVTLESELGSQSAVVPVPATAAVGLAPAMAAVVTLERLGFFLESCLEEKLLSRACSLAHAVMYRHGDVAIRPLVEAFRLEESLALLLETRSSDLSYEQLGAAETGLDDLLRCLEMLTTSDLSSIGPSLPRPPAPTSTPASNDSSNSSSGGGGRAGTTNVANASVLASTRGSIIRGLIKALMPWEHSRRSQRAALLVLGNILGNSLQETTDGNIGDLGDAQSSEYCKCATELRNAVTARCFEGGEGWTGDSGADGGGAAELSERDRCEKLSGTRDELLGNMTGLVKENATPGEEDKDGLEQEELLEGLGAVRAMLQGWPSRQ